MIAFFIVLRPNSVVIDKVKAETRNSSKVFFYNTDKITLTCMYCFANLKQHRKY